jgi:hypothetical protein
MPERRGRWGVLVAVLLGAVLIAPAVGAGGVAASSAAPAQLQEDTNASESSSGWTVDGLRELGPHPSGAPTSLRPVGDAGGYWIQYVPTGLMVSDTPDSRVNAAPNTVIERPYVYLNSFRGWDSDQKDATVHVVSWKPGTVERETANGTVQETVPVDVVQRETEVSLEGGTYDSAKVRIPESYGESKYVTMWIEGERAETQWVFRSETSKATQEIPMSTAGGLVLWGGWNIGLSMLATTVLMVLADRHLLKKIGSGPQVSPLEWAFFAFAAVFLGGVVFYQGVINTLVSRPYLLGVLGGIGVGLLAITVFSDDGEEALFIQFRPQEGTTAADGTGDLRVANEVHTVVERDRDGKKVVPRKGWLAALARAWPGVDATPVLEFDANHQRKAEAARDVEMPDDAGVWDRIRTRFLGSIESGDEYDVVYIVDPLADDVVQYQKETFAVETPDVVEWPDPEEEPERDVGGVTIPRVEWGRLGLGVAVVGSVYALTLGFVGSETWAYLGAFGALGVMFVRPVEGRALVELAPAQFDAVIATRMGLLEGYSEKSDAEYFQKELHREKAKRRAESRQATETEDETIFGELAEEMAPQREGDADDLEGGVAGDD